MPHLLTDEVEAKLAADLGRFPLGTQVGAYADDAFRGYDRAPAGEPIDTQASTGDGLTFTGLPAGRRFLAYAEVNGEHRFVSFDTTPAPPSFIAPNQKAALVGTAGRPGDRNRFVTDGDHRLAGDGVTESQAEALIEAALSPEWQPLEPFMASGWTAGESGSLVPAFRRIGDVVYFDGVVHHDGGSNPFATLPSGFRPSDGPNPWQHELGPTTDPATFLKQGRMLVAGGGQVQLLEGDSFDPMGVVLNGISFPIR